MCTSILYNAGDHYFGRNLDLEISFGQEVVVTPRDYQFDFRQIPALSHHYAIIGMALVKDNYPLYFDGANEEGLGMAGLNFDGPAHYFPVEEGKDNVSPFEFIPYVLGQCKNVNEAKELMKNMSLVNINFSDQLQLSPLHWLIADRSGKSIVVESTESGLHVYDNPVNVLTNNPEFPEHMTNLANYQSVSPAEPANQLAPNVDLGTYSRGLGSHMLPGGMDSRVALLRKSLLCSTLHQERVSWKTLLTTSTVSTPSNNRMVWTRLLRDNLNTPFTQMVSTCRRGATTTQPTKTTKLTRFKCAMLT